MRRRVRRRMRREKRIRKRERRRGRKGRSYRSCRISVFLLAFYHHSTIALPSSR